MLLPERMQSMAGLKASDMYVGLSPFFGNKQRRADPVIAKHNSIMQQTTIQFDEQQLVQQPVDVLAPIRKLVQSVTHFLDGRSAFYSQLIGQSISRRRALRIGVVLPALMVAVAMCVASSPLVAAVCLASAAWIVYRLNQQEGGRV